jgi:hypothetical protein
MDDCTRYAANIDRDRIDETLLPELDVVTMRSLGLREGDLIRVRKYIQVKFGKNDVAASGAGAGAGAGTVASPAEEAPAAGLFTGPGGRLAKNTRRGRPQRNATLPDTVDSDALAAASSQLSKVSLTPLEPAKPATPALASPVPPVSISPPPEEKKKPESGFDDDAWAIKPVAKAPSPSPVPVVTSPTEATGTDALLAQIQSLRPSSTGAVPGGAAFESIAAANAAIPQRAKSATLPPPSSYGLGGMPGVPLAQLAANATGMPQQMPQQVQQVPQVDLNAPRGPLAPVPANQGLLNPMHPQATGMFIPTHPTGVATQSPFAGGVPAGQYFASASAAAGMQPMATGMPVQPLQNMYTGFQQQSTFNTVAAIPPPAPVQPQATGAGGDKFAPSNIFNAMKRTDYGKREEEAAQAASEYKTVLSCGMQADTSL